MYNLDSFSYRKDPLVRIKRIGIYPLDDKGKTQYYSKDSFVHHYLRRSIRPEFFDNKPINDSEDEIKENEIKEEKKPELNQEEKKSLEILQDNNTINTINTDKILHTEPNIIKPLKDFQNKINNRNNTISASAQKDIFNRRYLNIVDKNKKLKLRNISNLKNKSYSQNKKTLILQKPIIHKKDNNRRNMFQSFDKKSRLTELQNLTNKYAKINYKLPKIMGGFGNQTLNRIEIIKTGTKDMGENYNPYNFIIPHVNRTKRNIFGSLFHS